ncbi:MAG: hypothetical protein GQ578_03945 [Desulfuromonadaceae bacterium]|nr:hypothetical protein [Desulfuromonadaceae bacterium]
MYPFLQQVDAGVILLLKVQPRSSCNQLSGEQDGALKVKLTSSPVEGAANRCCCEYLAKLFGIAKNRVELVAGAKSRKKRVLLHDLQIHQVSAVLDTHLK